MTTPLRLTQVSLHRFKAAYALENVPLRPFNVIIGRNGAGKSTLLEALQWIDTAVRHTTDVACDRYRGAKSLVNKRYNAQPPSFEIATRLESESGAVARHSCCIEDLGPATRVAFEELTVAAGDEHKSYISTTGGARRTPAGRITTDDRLALARIDELLPEELVPVSGEDLAAFWKNAVFLRLEPTDLARSAPLRRPSLAPLLDEVGATLPSLLEDLDDDGRADLVDMLRSVLPDVSGMKTFPAGDDRFKDYLLEEENTPGHRVVSIPSWMLSEGTRRMTAIFALLAHRPGPSLLCIEEIENGLDPVSVRKVLNYLYEASSRGVQVILTTHSPWLLDEVDLDDVLVVRRAAGDTTYTRLADDPASEQSDPRVRPGGRYIDLLEK